MLTKEHRSILAAIHRMTDPINRWASEIEKPFHHIRAMTDPVRELIKDQEIKLSQLRAMFKPLDQAMKEHDERMQLLTGLSIADQMRRNADEFNARMMSFKQPHTVVQKKEKSIGFLRNID